MACPAGGSGIDRLSSDVVEEILRRVDGKTLARAGCVCNEFGRMARDEGMWEDPCRSLCPSTALDRRLHHFISSSFGGFRKFYAHSFPFILHKFHDDSSHCSLHTLNDLPAVNATPPPSDDFISVVDVQYKQKSIYSRVLWGIPGADDLHGLMSSNCPFTIDLLRKSDGDETLAITDGLALISSTERDKEEGKVLKEVWDGMRLSWIVINKRTKQAANISSWSPLEGRRHWRSDKDFVIRFGSILPAHNILPCKVAPCVILMSCRICDDGPGQTNVKIIEISMRLEDMVGGYVNGNNTLLILDKALGCRRSTKHNEALECYHQYLDLQSEMMEEKMRGEAPLDALSSLIMAIGAFAMVCYFML